MKTDDILKKALEGKYPAERVTAMLLAKAEASSAEMWGGIWRMAVAFTFVPLILWWGWDWFLVPVFHLPSISVWQAWSGAAVTSSIRWTLARSAPVKDEGLPL